MNNLEVELGGSEFKIYAIKAGKRKLSYLTKDVALLYCIHPPQFLKFGTTDSVLSVFYSKAITLNNLRVFEFDESLPEEGVHSLNLLLANPSEISSFAKNCLEKDWHIQVIS
jgi:hypothetical protein